MVPLQLGAAACKFDYQMAMGVRYGEREWKQQIEGLIESATAEIRPS